MAKRTHPVKGPLTGQRFYWWKVLNLLSYPPDKKKHKQRYQCRCKCGIEKAVDTTNLIRGTSKSCGCRPYQVIRSAKFKPRFYGNFYIESISHYHCPGVAVYNIKCNCGKRVKLMSTNYKFQTGCSNDCPYTKARIKEVLASRKRKVK